jgi:hypothetical protein
MTTGTSGADPAKYVAKAVSLFYPSTFYPLKMIIFDQDRLGTDNGKSHKTETGFLRCRTSCKALASIRGALRSPSSTVQLILSTDAFGLGLAFLLKTINLPRQARVKQTLNSSEAPKSAHLPRQAWDRRARNCSQKVSSVFRR